MDQVEVVDEVGRRQLRGAIVAAAMFILLLTLDHFRWELLRLSHHNAAHNAVFNMGIAPVVLGSIFIISAFVVGGVVGNWNRIVLARNKYIPLLLTVPIIALVFIRILGI